VSLSISIYPPQERRLTCRRQVPSLLGLWVLDSNLTFDWLCTLSNSWNLLSQYGSPSPSESLSFLFFLVQMKKPSRVRINSIPKMIPTIAPTGSGFDSLEDDDSAALAVVAELSGSVKRDEVDRTVSLSPIVASGSVVDSRGGSLVSKVIDGCLVVVLVRTIARLGEGVVVTSSVNLKVGSSSTEDEGEGEG